MEKSLKILKKGYVCDNCLGRFFAQLLKASSNKERGKAIRTIIAMQADSGKTFDIDPSNLKDFVFRNEKIKVPKRGKCIICGNLFERMEKISEEVVRKLSSLEFKTFLVGTKISNDLAQNEESVWEELGTDYCEPMKAEINREIGKLVEQKTKKTANFDNPDINVVIDLSDSGIRLQINSLWVYGGYKKLVRGIPQTRWFCNMCRGAGRLGKKKCGKCKGKGKMYATSVQEIIAKPFLKYTKGADSSFHGAGREDIDARCLDWRPFLIEVLSPKLRKIDLKKIRREINRSGKVLVSDLKFSNKGTARKIKAAKPSKTYRALVVFEKPVKKDDLKKIKSITFVGQETPRRVMHRRADKLRKRKVLGIKWKWINKKCIELKIKAEAGMYIKELVHGDEGRTSPSIAGLLNNRAKVKELDVIKIEKIKV
ncbi:MAG: tRNA pseudouridine(54/55) synthase Pus10 [Candidatus Aenigmatarchaeota archaeon]